MGASFVHASGTVVFSRNPQRPASAMVLQQPSAETSSGLRYGGGVLAVERTLILHWPTMLSADWSDLLAFFSGIVGGMADSFTYTDPGGSDHTVRFADPELAASEVSADSYAVTVRLLEA